MALTFKQRLFVSYYLGDSNGNATDAARRAGYGSPEIRGCELVRNRKVRLAIDARMDGAAISANEVLARISELASGTLGDFVEIGDDDNWRVSLRKAKRLRKLGLIKKLKVTKDGATEIELHDPQAALEKLVRYYGLDARTAMLLEQHRELKARIDALEKADAEQAAGEGRPMRGIPPVRPDGGA